MFGVDELERLRKEWAVIRAAPISFVIVCLVATGLIWTFFHFTYSERINGADGRVKNAQDDAAHWHQTADYYKDLVSRPVQHETPSVTSEPAPPNPSTSDKKPGSTKAPGSTEHHQNAPNKRGPNMKPPQALTTPTVSAPNGVAIGRDNNGTAVVNNIGTIARTLSLAQRERIAATVGPQPTGFAGVSCILGDQEGCGFATELMEALRSAGWRIGGLREAIYSIQLDGVFVAIAPEDSAAPPEGVLQMYDVLRSAGVPAEGVRMNRTPVGKFRIIVGAHTKPG